MRSSRRFVAVSVVALVATAWLPARAQERPATPVGPDAFGYVVYDQSGAECAFDFVDIAASGAAVSFTASGASPADDDGGAVIVPVLPFELYGVAVSGVVMSSNGYLAMASSLVSDAGGDFSNDRVLPAVPDQAPGVPGRILAYHDELSGFATSGSAYHEHFAPCPRPSEALGSEPCTIFQWTDWGFAGGGEPFDFQVVVYHQTSEIVVQLRPAAAVLADGTIGIQNPNATIGSQYRPEVALTADTAVCFFEPRFPSGGPVADLEVSKNDRLEVVTPGQQAIRYEIGVLNRGPSPVDGAQVSDAIPPGLVNCIWTCLSSEGSLCSSSGTGDIDDLVSLDPSGWADYILVCNADTVPATVSNTVTATPPAGVTDPDPGGNSATDIDASGAGRVPDGALVPGPEVLRIDHVGSQLVLTWGASCLTSDVDYQVYEGDLGEFTSHEPVACSTQGALGYSHAVPAGDTYYLVVPTNELYEGSYGLNGSGDERARGPAACLPQAIGGCL
ncbi:MAG: hypothetical protein R3344_01555 [Acidobacteriota bacterium]|nr:hypothetical protein [Acidobacteriota bacterium]